VADSKSDTNLAEKLLSDLRGQYRILNLESSVSRFLLFAGIFLIGFSLLVLFEKLFFLQSAIKAGAWLGILISAFAAAYWIGKNRDFTEFKTFYRAFCDKYNFSNLENALDLYLDPAENKSGLHLLAIERNLQQIDRVEFIKNLKDYTSRHLKHRIFISAFSLLLVSILLAGTVAWSNADPVKRAFVFWQEFEKPNPYTFVVVPGDTTLEHGSMFEPEINITGEGTSLPTRVSLAIKTNIEDEFRYRPMENTGDGIFRSYPIELTNDATYYVRLDEYLTEEHNVSVQLRPRFDSLTAHIQPPSYTGISGSERDYPFAQLRAYGGSEIYLTGTVNKPVSQLVLDLGDQEVIMTTGDEDSLKLSASFTVEKSDTIRFRITDLEGLSNQNSFRFIMNLIEDEYPVVVIRQPEGNISAADPDELDIFYQAADDFGLTGARLNWELHRAFTTEPIRNSKDLDTPEIGEPDHIRWQLDNLDLRPRDKLTFWITVWDNDTFNGYKSSDSQQLVLEVPSVSASLEQLDQRERNVQDALDEVSDSYRQMEQEYDRFRERLKQNTEPGWEENQILEDVQEQQRDIDESIKNLNEQFEEIRREIESSNQVSEETRRAYNELQDLIEQLDDPELQRALEELRRSMENLNPRDLQRAMEEFEFNEQVYKDRIERTLELFKTLKMNSDLDKLAAQYDDLANRMENISNDGENAGEQEEQQAIREDTDYIDRQLENLDNRPPRRAEERLRQLKEETRNELRDIQDKLDQMIQENNDEQNGNGQQEQIRQEQQQISQQFEQRAEALRDAQQQMSGQQIQVNLLSLQQALYTLLELSETQEVLTMTTGRTESRSQGYVELARNQQNVSNQFSLVADTLFQVSSEIPSLSNRINQKKVEIERTLSRSVEQMVEREQRTSVITSRESLGGINDLASMLAEAIDQLMDQQSGDGAGGAMSLQQMLEQMQNMSGDQEMMNQQLQDLINDIQGNRLTQDQSERLEQLARQQNEIRQQLQQLQRSGALRQGDRTLSELQRMAEEMEDAINDMRGGMTDPLMIDRQQNILSRMLDAEQSLQERGQSEDEYEGQRAEDFDRAVPPDITLEELRQEIRSRLQDPQYTRFRDDYQLLIERYFEQLRLFEGRPLP